MTQAQPPAINFTIPFVPVAIMVIVNANGVQPDGTNVPTPDTTSALVISNLGGTPPAATIAVDPSNNRRLIITPSLLTPGGPPGNYTYRVSVAGKTSTVTITGQTAAPLDASGVVWDGASPSPA